MSFMLFSDQMLEKTTVMISHRLGSCQIADRILVLSDGRADGAIL